jgi:putative oxidoreductase
MATTAVALNRTKAKSIILWLLRGLAAVAFFGAGGAKLAGATPMVVMFARLGLGQWFRYVTGLIEVVGAIGILIPRFSRYAALLLSAVMVGAIVSHLTVLGGNPPIMLFLIVVAIAWLSSR